MNEQRRRRRIILIHPRLQLALCALSNRVLERACEHGADEGEREHEGERTAA